MGAAKSTPISPRTTVSDALASHEAAARLFLQKGMGACVGCAMAAFDTLEVAAAEYGLTVAEVVETLQKLEATPPESCKR